MDNPGEDILLKATTGSQPFDTHIYLYESVGTLISLVRDPEEQRTMLQAAFGPLIQELATSVQKSATIGTSASDLLQVLQVHHVILAIGAIARGFPEPGGGSASGLVHSGSSNATGSDSAFEQPSQAILQGLEAYKGYRIIRDAARTALAGVISTLGTRGTHLVPPLVIHTVDLFEPQELLDFLSFLGMLAHRLRGDIRPILDELAPILFDRVYALLATPATGTDESILQSNMKKGYLSFLQTIFTDELDGIFISERNKPRLDTFINHLLSITTDNNDRLDRSAQKAAIFILMRTVQNWSTLQGVPTAFLTEGALYNKESKKNVKLTSPVIIGGASGANGTTPNGTNASPGDRETVQGYERVAYERMVPAMFQTILDGDFKIKDGQASLVSVACLVLCYTCSFPFSLLTRRPQVVYEIANFLRELVAARGAESIDFFENSGYFGSIGCPPAATAELLNHVRSDTVKDFKKFFGDFMKEWKAGLGAA